MKNFTFQKNSRKNSLASAGKSCRPETINADNQYTCHDLSVWNKRQKSHLISENVFLPKHNLPIREKENIIGTSSILTWRKSRELSPDPPPPLFLRYGIVNARKLQCLQFVSSHLKLLKGKLHFEKNVQYLYKETVLYSLANESGLICARVSINCETTLYPQKETYSGWTSSVVHCTLSNSKLYLLGRVGIVADCVGSLCFDM